MMEEFITTLLVNAAVFSVLFGILLLVRGVLRKRLSAVWQYVLWMVVLIKLVIPFGWESALSPAGWFPQPPEPAAVVEEIDPVTDPMPVIDSFIAPEHGESAAASDAGLPDMPSANNETAAPPAARSLTWAQWAMILWGAGAAVTAGWLLLCLYQVRGRILRRRIQVPDPVLQVFAACKQALNIRRPISIRMQTAVPVPAITGVFRPVLILPVGIETGDEETLRHIILHELTHYKKGDLVMIQVMNALNVLYWFNPLVWLCFRLMRKDMETICDQRVLGMTDRERQVGYVDMLLQFASASQNGALYAAMSLNDGRADMEERIRNMCKRPRMGRGVKAAVVLIAVLMLAGGILTACRPLQETGDSIDAEKWNEIVQSMDGLTISPLPQAEEQAATPVPEDTSIEDGQNAVTTPVLLRGALVGGLVRGEWLPADAFYRSGAVDFDGYRYDVYLNGTYEGEATGGPFSRFLSGEPVGPDGDIYNSDTNLIGDDQVSMVAGIALSADADWDLYPRAYAEQFAYNEQITGSAEYQALAENMLVQAGLADPVTELRQVVTVDLDGDGTDEVLIAADNTWANETMPGKGDNAILVFRRMSGGQAIDQTVDSYIFLEDWEPVSKIQIWVPACADLDGDGCLEVITYRTDGMESVTCIVYKLIDGQLVQVASNGLGWGSGEFADPGGAR